MTSMSLVSAQIESRRLHLGEDFLLEGACAFRPRCANSMARRQKTSVRLALGAPRGRLIRQTLTESLVIAVAGSVVAVLLAVFGSRAMLSMALSGTQSSPFSTSPSWTVLGFALGVAVLAGARVAAQIVQMPVRDRG